VYPSGNSTAVSLQVPPFNLPCKYAFSIATPLLSKLQSLGVLAFFNSGSDVLGCSDWSTVALFKRVWGFPDVPSSPSQKLCNGIPLVPGLMSFF
jgi:hypothetical protein